MDTDRVVVIVDDVISWILSVADELMVIVVDGTSSMITVGNITVDDLV